MLEETQADGEPLRRVARMLFAGGILLEHTHCMEWCTCIDQPWKNVAVTVVLLSTMAVTVTLSGTNAKCEFLISCYAAYI